MSPIFPGESERVSRFSSLHFDTQDGLIRKARPIDRIVSPASKRSSAVREFIQDKVWYMLVISSMIVNNLSCFANN